MLYAQYRKNLTWEGWGKCAPTHTRKNRVGLPPPSVRATCRHGHGRKQARNRAHKRHFYTSRPTSRQRQKDTTRGHTRRHKAKEGRRATRATTKGHRRTTSPAKNRPERPPASGRRKTASGHRQTAGERREGDTPTPRARAHTSRTAADMHARGRYACSYVAILYIYYYILFFMPLYIFSLSLYIIAFFFLLFIVLFAPLSACALCARVILPRLCIFMQYLCIFIYKVSIYRYFMQFLFIMRFLCKVALSYRLYYIYTMRATLWHRDYLCKIVYIYSFVKIFEKIKKDCEKDLTRAAAACIMELSTKAERGG